VFAGILLEQEQMWAGLDCVCGELIGSWIIITHIIREEILQEEDSRLPGTNTDKSFIIHPAIYYIKKRFVHFDFMLNLKP